MEKDFKQRRRDFLKLLGIGSGAALFGKLPMALAKEIYPAERITWNCNVKAGGAYDLVARSINPFLTQYLRAISKEAKGGEIVIKNLAEAGGRRAYSSTFYAKPDGYTIGDFNTAFVTDNITDKIEFDVNKYTFLVRMGFSLRVLLARKDGPKTWEEMMKKGKEKEIKWGASSFGRGHHVTSILIKDAAKIPARLVNFPGAVENGNALMRGDIDVAMMAEDSAKGMIDAGEFRVLTVFSEKSSYPGVPSIAQLGYPELADPSKLHMLVIGPPGLPNEISGLLISAFRRVFGDKEFLDRMKKLDFELEPLYGTDAERVAKTLFRFYEGKTPILKKYLM